MYEIIAVFGILSVLITFIVFLALQRWFYAWEGVLKEKKIKKDYGFSNTNDSDFAPECVNKYILIFETLDGKTIRLEVNSSKYKSAEIGARYVKLRKSWKFKRFDY